MKIFQPHSSKPFFYFLIFHSLTVLCVQFLNARTQSQTLYKICLFIYSRTMVGVISYTMWSAGEHGEISQTSKGFWYESFQ